MPYPSKPPEKRKPPKPPAPKPPKPPAPKPPWDEQNTEDAAGKPVPGGGGPKGTYTPYRD